MKVARRIVFWSGLVATASIATAIGAEIITIECEAEYGGDVTRVPYEVDLEKDTLSVRGVVIGRILTTSKDLIMFERINDNMDPLEPGVSFFTMPADGTGNFTAFHIARGGFQMRPTHTCVPR